MSVTALECEREDCSRPAQASIREAGRSLHVCSTCADEVLEEAGAP